MPAKAIPVGYEHVTPYLIVKGAAQAMTAAVGVALIGLALLYAGMAKKNAA